MATQRRGIQSVEISALVLEALEEAGGAVPLSKLAAMTNMQLRLSRGSEADCRRDRRARFVGRLRVCCGLDNGAATGYAALVNRRPQGKVDLFDDQRVDRT